MCVFACVYVFTMESMHILESVCKLVCIPECHDGYALCLCFCSCVLLSGSAYGRPVSPAFPREPAQ